MATEDVQDFVGSLKDFNNRLSPGQQAMLGRILDAASLEGTAGYGRYVHRSENDETEQDDTAGYGKRIHRSENDDTEQGETAGYGRMIHQSETAGQDDERWERLAAWLGEAEGSEDETEGFGRSIH